MANDKPICQYCGKHFSKAGIHNHMKSCTLNPANVVVEDAPVIDIDAPKVKATPKEQLVKIKLRQKFECYIGDRYWRFAHGEVVEVPVNVKNTLLRAGLLEMV